MRKETGGLDVEKREGVPGVSVSMQVICNAFEQREPSSSRFDSREPRDTQHFT